MVLILNVRHPQTFFIVVLQCQRDFYKCHGNSWMKSKMWHKLTAQHFYLLVNFPTCFGLNSSQCIHNVNPNTGFPIPELTWRKTETQMFGYNYYITSKIILYCILPITLILRIVISNCHNNNFNHTWNFWHVSFYRYILWALNPTKGEPLWVTPDIYARCTNAIKFIIRTRRSKGTYDPYVPSRQRPPPFVRVSERW